MLTSQTEPLTAQPTQRPDTNTQAKKERLIFAWNYCEWGGAQIYALSIIKEAIKRYVVVVAMPRDSSAELINMLENAGAICEFFGPEADHQPVPNLIRKLQRRCRIIRSENALVRYLQKKGLDNTFVNIDLAPQSSFLTLLRLSIRTHVFYTIHNSLPDIGRIRKIIWTIKLRLMSAIKQFHFFAANEDAKRSLSEYLTKAATTRITLIRAAIDPSAIENILNIEIDRAKILGKLSLPKDKMIILTVGQFIDRKGRWTHLEAVSRICRLRDDILFIWVMPRLPSEEDLAKVEAYVLGNKFRMILSRDVGSSRESVLNFFRVADLFVLPSFVEGVPIALLEAMALGLASISTNVYGIPEAIESGKNGFLVQAGDSLALEEVILRLVDDRDLRERVAKAGQEFVLANFDERESARIALEEYDKCFAS